MIWEQNVNTIVMTTNITEKDEPKCAPYVILKCDCSYLAIYIRLSILKTQVNV